MKLMKYKDLLGMAKEKIDEALAPLRAREMKKKGELEICKLENRILEKQQKVQEYAAQYPINYDCLMDCLDDLELTERKKNQLEKILTEMFGSEK